MIHALRKKFVLVAAAALAGTLLVLCMLLNGAFYWMNTTQADSFIQMLHENGGSFPEESIQDNPSVNGMFQITPETEFEIRYFIMRVSPEGEILETDVDHIAAFDRASTVNIAENVLAAGADAGYYQHYRFGVFEEADGSTTVVVLDRFTALQANASVLMASVAAACAILLMVVALLIPLSKRVVRPFAENLQCQRRFITDASHELKTPLAIIAADAEVVEATSGQSQWTRSIKAQVSRMDDLVKGLVELTRAAEAPQRQEFYDFSLSTVAECVAEDFRPLAEAAGKPLETFIEQDVFVKGSREGLERLCIILMDNAVKYGDEGTPIRLIVARRHRSAVLSVENHCAAFDPNDAPLLFDRFYRADSSRARETGGYGIGLSIARAIAERHGAKLQAVAHDGMVEFTLTLPAGATKP